MTMNLSDPILVRQYLLGRLDDQEERENEISEEIYFNDEMSQVVESVEDEIIEEYLDGTLDPADVQAVNDYFLRPRERKEKLWFARLLRHSIESKAVDPVLSQLAAHPEITQAANQNQPAVRPVAYRRLQLTAYGSLAALVVLSVVSLVQLSAMRKIQARLEGDLAQERQRSASVEKRAPVLEASIVPLTLVADRSRDISAVPRIDIKTATQRILVEIALPSGASGPYEVRLETKAGNGPLWSATLLPLVAPSGDARLVFDLPVDGIQSDVYSFAVRSTSSSARGPSHYDFQITR